MKNQFIKKTLSITITASVITTSLQLANPVTVYASNEGIAIDTNNETSMTEDTESLSEDTEAADEDLIADSVSEKIENTENSESNQDQDIEEAETNENAIDNDLAEEEVEAEEIVSESISNDSSEMDNVAIGEKAVLEEAADKAINAALGEANGEPYSNNADYAKEGYGEGNENRPSSTTLDVVLGNGIRFILSGLNDALINNAEKKEEIVNSIKAFLGNNNNNENSGESESDKTIKDLQNPIFVDAEKYSNKYDGYDSNYCWGAAASNMLWISGWAQGLGYTNEDKIMSDLHDKFEDKSEEPLDAITWLFDNYTTNVDVQTKADSTLGGKDTSVCISEALNPYENVAGELKNLASLANVASQATAIQCRWAEDGSVKEGSHWLTAVGVVINESATNIADYFKAVIVADSDDSAGNSTSAPSSAEESYNQRRDTVNSYKICTLDTTTVGGVNYWYMPGYKNAAGKSALITGIESLAYFSSDLKNRITEQVGTKDVTESIELLSNGKMYAYGENASEPQRTFSGESTNLRIDYTNVSSVSVENVQVPIRVTIRNNKNQELDSKVYYVPTDRINANSKGYFDINIDDLINELGEGEFVVRVVLNPQDAENKLQEAYYLNNDDRGIWITRTAKRGGEVVNENDQTSISDSDNDGDSSSTDSSSTELKVNPQSPAETTPQTAAVPSYTAPEKVVVATSIRENTDGTTTEVATRVDGSISETTKLTKAAVAEINSAGKSATAPTVVNGVSVVVDKTDATVSAKISSVTAVVDLITKNGKMNLTPQMISGIKNVTSSQVGAKSSVDLKVNTLAADGKSVSVIVTTDSLKNNAVLKGYVKDPLTGGYILVDVPNIKYDNKAGLTVAGLSGGYEYKFVSTNEAKAIENSILSSVKVSEEFAKPVAASAGSAVDMTKALSTGLNSANVNKIEYYVSGNKATINPATGQLTINENASKGTITVNIKVTLKNGKTKVVRTKIKIG